MKIPKRLLILHKNKWEMYHVANSMFGLRRTARLKVNGQDIDCLLTKEGIPVATHWQKPLRHGFKDPLGKIPSGKNIGDMPWREVSRLRSRDGRGFRIYTVRRILKESARLNITACLELKPDHRWGRSRPYDYIKKYSSKYNAPVIVMQFPRAKKITYLVAAKKAGMTTLLLMRGPVPRNWWQHLDYCKGRASWAAGKPDYIKRLGPGSPHGRSITTLGAAVTARRR